MGCWSWSALVGSDRKYGSYFLRYKCTNMQPNPSSCLPGRFLLQWSGAGFEHGWWPSFHVCVYRHMYKHRGVVSIQRYAFRVWIMTTAFPSLIRQHRTDGQRNTQHTAHLALSNCLGENIILQIRWNAHSVAVLCSDIYTNAVYTCNRLLWTRLCTVDLIEM